MPHPKSTHRMTCCLALLAALSTAGHLPAARYEIGLADGTRQVAQRITQWTPRPPSLKLDDRSWLDAQPTLRWIFDRESPVAGALEGWLETWTGDCLPGQVLRHSDTGFNSPPHPPYLTVLSVTSSPPPRHAERAQVRVRTDCVRRIVWLDQQRRYEPGTAITRDGRQFAFRVLRWGPDSVTLLAEEGRHSLTFQELAELNLPAQPAWPQLYDELALLAPQGDQQLLQVETSAGVIATTSWSRQHVALPQDRSKMQHWLLGVQPAWCLDVLWLSGNEIPMRRFFGPHELPLSRLWPSAVVQQSPVAGSGRPWQRDRNVEGGLLRSGPGIFGWGFGVHAHNELHFPLDSLVRAWQGFVGLDALAATGGCVRARTLLLADQRQTVFESPVIVGSSQAYATGLRPLSESETPRTLVLQVEHVHDERPPGADPLDIRDSTDWLDPLLLLDQSALRELLASHVQSHIGACRDWQWTTPAGTQLHFQPIWDELSEATSRFALGVAVTGSEPLRLTRRQPLAESPRELQLTVSTPLPARPPLQMEVLVDGQSVARFDVPLLDRAHPTLKPQIIKWDHAVAPDRDFVDLELRQYPGDTDAVVQWHAVELR